MDSQEFHLSGFSQCMSWRKDWWHQKVARRRKYICYLELSGRVSRTNKKVKPIPYICHFFYTDRVFENQILHPKKRLKSPKTLKMSLKKSYICIFFTHSGKIYTWQKIFTQTCLWCLWQIKGMDFMNLPISKTSLYELTYPKHSERTQSGRVVAMPLPETTISEIFYLLLLFPTSMYIYVGPHFQNWEFNLNLVEVPPCSDTQLHHLEPKITESLHKLRKVVHVLEILTILLEILITVCWKYWYFC